jgi:hypothetical protein
MVSLHTHRFKRTKRKNNPKKLKKSTTPMLGWIMRVFRQPPKMSVRKNRLGSNSASPDRPSNTRHDPLECWVHPSAYIDVIVLVGEDSAIILGDEFLVAIVLHPPSDMIQCRVPTGDALHDVRYVSSSLERFTPFFLELRGTQSLSVCARIDVGHWHAQRDLRGKFL